ncbi:hypothetical protein J2T13_003909 [Paenibacillus sp. DS2015]|uniref:mediterrocin family bacteriocin n=1 Tax=Paenibacillus sp. DS2015 TaxID=3373917 RepID=UPI003D23A96C
MLLLLLLIAVSGQGFANSWTLYDSGGTGFHTWEVNYGFNKWAIDEDFIHGYHDSKAHQVKLTNASGTIPFVDSDIAGNWAEIDVRHAGNFVYYDFNY